MIAPATQRRLLQIVIAAGGLVPVGAGLLGVVQGSAMVPDAMGGVGLDSHVRYLSGLLLAIGIVFWSTIPGIERQTRTFRLLTFIVFVGGLARLAGLLQGVPPGPMLFGLVMELGVTPLLCVWQARVARHHGRE